MKSYKQFINESGDTNWDLYSSHPQHKEAHNAMNRAWEVAKKKTSAKDAEDHMVKVMKRYSHVGASDTEPRHILHDKLKKHFKDYTRPDFFEQDRRGKFL